VTAPDQVWQDRTLVAVARMPGGTAGDVERVAVEVALRFADRFAPADREFAGLSDRPRWQDTVTDCVAALRSASLLEPGALTLTAAGRDAATAAERRLADAGAASPAETGDGPAAPRLGVPVVAGVISAPLRNPGARTSFGLSTDEDAPVPVMVDLNLQYRSGPADALRRLEDLWACVTGGAGEEPIPIAGRYLAGELTMRQIKRLVAADAVPIRWPYRSIHHVWPDFPVRPQVDASCVTIKADAARNSFDADGRGIVWAVIDSGIDAGHPHFAHHRTLDHESVRDLHRFFPVAGAPVADGALTDGTGHGTHVAGIIAGAVTPWLAEKPDGRRIYATESRFNVENPNRPMRVPREITDSRQVAGMAPRTRLVSLKALGGGGTREDRVHRVVQALAYVREINGDSIDGMRIHGVNLSLGYEFDPQWFACGRSPLCQEIDRLVRTGVVVVVAAGNSGYGTLNVTMDAPATFGFAMTINDPGNAELAITVGSTHRTSPHTYGVSYFSSKGPTGDGRTKPDLVAPGERITSCAAGDALRAVTGDNHQPPDTAVYVEDTGTSMAAPHVSGAIAALLSVRREFIGEPDRVKRIFIESATDLGRRREFQGAGLVDLMRALQLRI
jgi:subtilisin family serine protease